MQLKDMPIGYLRVNHVNLLRCGPKSMAQFGGSAKKSGVYAAAVASLLISRSSLIFRSIFGSFVLSLSQLAWWQQLG